MIEFYTHIRYFVSASHVPTSNPNVRYRYRSIILPGGIELNESHIIVKRETPDNRNIYYDEVMAYIILFNLIIN